MTTAYQATSPNVLSEGGCCGTVRARTFDRPCTRIYQRLHLTLHNFRGKRLMERLCAKFTYPMIVNSCAWASEKFSEHPRNRCMKQTALLFEHIPVAERHIAAVFQIGAATQPVLGTPHTSATIIVLRDCSRAFMLRPRLCCSGQSQNLSDYALVDGHGVGGFRHCHDVSHFKALHSRPSVPT